MQITSIIPFALILLAIALLPLFDKTRHWFESNKNKAVLSGGLGAIAIAILIREHDNARTLIAHTGHEYSSFVILLGALYVVTGGIRITGNLPATPGTNTGILALGAIVASAIGTTGAAMMLIRLVLETNKERKYKQHTGIFFIWIVANAGGLLTPLGDPPLFLGFLQGVPFTWTLNLFPHWLVMNGSLLAIYFVIDRVNYQKESLSDIDEDASHVMAVRVEGKINFLLLAANIAAILWIPTPYRELCMLAISGTSLVLTHSSTRRLNGFTWGPIVEVAVLFAGIFATMIPALEFMKAHAHELPLSKPWHFYIATGALSSFLDNAPTYLTFLTIAQGQGLTAEVVGVPHVILAAISVGSVLWGANTYIGNGPNFLVKAVCEERDSAGRPQPNNIPMPTFFGYIGWSAFVLLPLEIAVGLIFF